MEAIRRSAIPPVLSFSWLVLVIACYAYTVWRTVTSPPNRSPLDLPLTVAWLCLGLVLIALVATGRGRRLLYVGFGLLGLGALTVSLVGGNLPSILVFIWLLFVAWALGGRLLRLLLGIQSCLDLRCTVFAVGLGFACYSLLALALAITALLYAWLAWGFLIILTVALRSDLIAGAKTLLRFLRSFTRWSEAGRSDGNNNFLAAVALITGLVLLTALIGSLAPEIHYDALNYHLSVPRIYADNHRLVDLSYFYHSNFAHNVEMDFALGLLLGGQRTAKLFHFAFGVLTGLAILAFGRDFVSTRIGILASVLFFTTPFVAWEMTLAYVDLAVTFYVFAALYAATQWWHSQRGGWLTVSGIMAGLAVAAKLNALLFVLPLALSIVAIGVARKWRGLRQATAQLTAWGAPALASALPWLALTYAVTGNPVFPFFNTIFNSPLWSRSNTFFNLARFGTGRGLPSFLTLPLDMAYQSTAFTEANCNGVLGPILLLPLCLIFLPSRIRPVLWFLAFFASASLALWFVIGPFLRFILPLWPVVCIMAAYSMARLANRLSSLWRPELAIGAVNVLLLAMLIAERPIDVVNAWDIPERIPYRVALGLEPRDQYLSRILPVYGALRFMNHNYDAPSARILTIADEFRLYSQVPLESVWTSRRLRVLEQPMTEAQLTGLIRQWGFTHLLVNRNSLPLYPNMVNIPILDESFLRAHADLEYADREVYVYRFVQPESFSTCLQLNTEEANGQLGSGWYRIEEDGVNRWRWMGRESWLLLGVEDAKPSLQIAGHAVTEHFETDQLVLRVFVDEQLVGEEYLDEGDFLLAFEVPRHLREDQYVRIRLAVSDTFVPNGEMRELGIIVHTICFR